MLSKKQLEANRSNAKKSTGPISAEGKVRSALNALKHGLTAQRMVTIVGEAPGLYAKFCSDLVEEYAPETVFQAELVQQAADLLWRLRRVPAFEAAILNAGITYTAMLHPEPGPEREDEELHRPVTESIFFGHTLVRDATSGGALSKLTRHETSLLNALKKTLQMLEEAKRTNGAD